MGSLYEAIHGYDGWIKRYNQGSGSGTATSRKEKQETYLLQSAFAGNFHSQLKLSALEGQLLQAPFFKNVSGQITVDEEKFKDPYGRKFKERLLDMFLNDHVCQEAIEMRAWAAYGRPKDTTVYPLSNRQYKSTDELNQVINETFQSEPEFRKFTKYVQDVDAVTKVHETEQEMFRQSVVGARAATYIESFTTDNNPYKFPKGTPAILKPLNWMELDQVRINPKSWRITDIKYNDFDDEKSDSDETKDFIASNKLLYFVRPAGHMIPEGLYYGISDLHSILKCSEVIRQILERDALEIVTSMWSSSGVFEFEGMNKKEQTDFMTQLKPALFRGWNKKVKFTPVQLKHDGWFLMNILDIMVKHILARLRVPRSMIFGDIENRAVGEAQLTSWQQTTVLRDREWSGSHMSAQWYKTLCDIWYGEKTDKFYIKVVRAFLDIEFEDVLAKANAIELLIRRNIITPAEARMMFPNLKEIDSDELRRLEDEEFAKKEREMQLQQKMFEERMKSQQEAGGFGGAAGGPGQAPGQEKNGSNKDDKKEFGKKTPKDRANAKIVASVGAGRGNQS